MRSPLLPALLLSLAALTAGCGGDEPPPPATLESCRAAGWTPLTPLRPYLDPRDLVMHEGELFYEAEDTTPGSFAIQIEAQPVTGGAPRVVTQEDVLRLWVEGDQVFFVHGIDLKKVPVAGGASSVALAGPPSALGKGFSQLLTPTDFVWSQGTAGDDLVTHNEIWAAARSGGAPRRLAVVDEVSLVSRLEQAGDEVIVADGSKAFAIPLDGGPVRPLAPGLFYLEGVEPVGVYTSGVVQPADSSFEQFEVSLSPIDGGPRRPFWPDLPPRIGPEQIWSDGQGGWLVSAIQVFDDGVIHHALYLLDGQQHATLAACDPSPTAEDYFDVRPAFTPEAVFLVMKDFTDVSHARWRILKVPRP